MICSLKLSDLGGPPARCDFSRMKDVLFLFVYVFPGLSKLPVTPFAEMREGRKGTLGGGVLLHFVGK